MADEKPKDKRDVIVDRLREGASVSDVRSLMDAYDLDVNDRIYALRKGAYIAGTDLARSVGAHFQLVSRWDRHKRDPSGEFIIRCFHELGKVYDGLTLWDVYGMPDPESWLEE